MAGKTAVLRKLLAEETFIHLPVAYDAIGGRLIEKTGFKAAYVGGFVTGGSRATSEPLLTLDEQVRLQVMSPRRSRYRCSPTPAPVMASRCTRCGRCASSSMRASLPPFQRATLNQRAALLRHALVEGKGCRLIPGRVVLDEPGAGVQKASNRLCRSHCNSPGIVRKMKS